MQPTQVAQPFHHKGWVYEEKVDGYRMLAHRDGDGGAVASGFDKGDEPGAKAERA
jgi:ATP-dependent DNA ligase